MLPIIQRHPFMPLAGHGTVEDWPPATVSPQIAQWLRPFNPTNPGKGLMTARRCANALAGGQRVVAHGGLPEIGTGFGQGAWPGRRQRRGLAEHGPAYSTQFF